MNKRKVVSYCSVASIKEISAIIDIQEETLKKYAELIFNLSKIYH